MGYCTAPDVLAQLRGVDMAALGDASDQAAAILNAVSVATAEVDVRCRRTFAPPATASTRLFDGTGGYVLRVADMVRLDGISVGGAAAAPIYAYPQSGPPFGWVSTGGRFPPGHGNVAVTALWGYAAAVPDDVALATACLAGADILRRVQISRSGGVSKQTTGSAGEEFPAGGPYADTMEHLSDTACRILLPYRRWMI